MRAHHLLKEETKYIRQVPLPGFIHIAEEEADEVKQKHKAPARTKLTIAVMRVGDGVIGTTKLPPKAQFKIKNMMHHYQLVANPRSPEK